jgi:hypothetical protein
MDEFRLFPDLEGLLRNLWRKYKCRYTSLSGVGSCWIILHRASMREWAALVNFGRLA